VREHPLKGAEPLEQRLGRRRVRVDRLGGEVADEQERRLVDGRIGAGKALGHELHAARDAQVLAQRLRVVAV